MRRSSLPPPAVPTEWVGMLPRLRRYARVLAVQADVADDLVAATLARARHTRFAAPTPSSALSVMAIMHRLHERGRRGSRDESVPTRDAATGDGAAGGRREVLDLLWQLATHEREVLLLVAVECLAYEDVAALLDVPAATVMARLAAARAKLRTLLQMTPNG